MKSIENNKNKGDFMIISKNMINEIFMYLDGEDLTNFSTTSKIFRKVIVDNNKVFKRYIQQRFPSYFYKLSILNNNNYTDQFKEYKNQMKNSSDYIQEIENKQWNNVNLYRKRFICKKSQIEDLQKTIPVFINNSLIDNLLIRFKTIEGVEIREDTEDYYIKFSNNKRKEKVNKKINEHGFILEYFTVSEKLHNVRLTLSDGEFEGQFSPRSVSTQTFEDFLFNFFIDGGHQNNRQLMKPKICPKNWQDIFVQVDEDFDFIKLIPFFDNRIINSQQIMNDSNNQATTAVETISGFQLFEQ